jgi:hypothetical protein
MKYKHKPVGDHSEKAKRTITPDIFILKMTCALWRQNTFTLNDSRPLVPKYSEFFTGSAPPTLYPWSYFTIGCSSPSYSRSASLIRSAYLFLYINFCFRFNKSLTNLTSLLQHHLQYRTFFMTGAYATKLFCPEFTSFHAWVECLLEQAGEACQG